MKIRNKNGLLKDMIGDFVKHSYENKSMIWRAIAASLNKPTRNQSKINVYHLNKYAKKNDVIVVPGAVLGTGKIEKPITVAALKFSSNASDKIKKAGGKTLGIVELFKEKPDGKGIRIMG